MQHDILGEVQLTEGGTFDAVAMVLRDSRNIEINISRDSQSLEVAISLAAEVVRRLPDLDKLAKQVATRSLRDTYNEYWREYDEVQEDGSLETVTNSELSEAEFEAKLSLKSVSVSVSGDGDGDGGIDFLYHDDGMFDGHSIVVSPLEGLDFSTARATLFG